MYVPGNRRGSRLSRTRAHDHRDQAIYRRRYRPWARLAFRQSSSAVAELIFGVRINAGRRATSLFNGGSNGPIQ